MGKAAKTKRSEERKRRRRAEKDARKQQYAAWRDAGINKKSKRFQQNQQRKTINVFKAPNRNRRTTYEVEVIGPDGKKYIMPRGGTLSAKQFGFNNLRADKAKRNQ